MNINVFFGIIIGSLLAVFFFFEPLNIKKQDFGEIPVFELENFKLIELDQKGLSTIMDGTKGIRYTNRYIVYNIDYTDNSKKYLANMNANKGLYKGNIINLDGNITYNREDGIVKCELQSRNPIEGFRRCLPEQFGLSWHFPCIISE